MTKQIPEYYFDNLENYEDFLLRRSLLGFELDKEQLHTFFRQIAYENIWIVETKSGIVFVNLKNEQVFSNNIKNFDCSLYDNLTSLKGAPQEVGGNFNCMCCKNLTSLEGAPQEVGGNFGCRGCIGLTSLKGAPQEVCRDFDCSHCKNLTSLEGAPIKVKGDCYFNDCDKLSTKQIDDYLEFLKHPTPEHIDETGHYKP